MTRTITTVGTSTTAWLGYEAPPGTTYGTNYITPDLANSCYTRDANDSYLTFRFWINSNFGNLQNNSFSTILGLDPDTPSPLQSGTESYFTGWVNDPNPSHYATFDIAPTPVTSPWFATTANSTWWSPSSGPDNTNGQGRGAVTLKWPAAQGANGYNIYLWDGYQYDQVGTTTATSWSTSGMGIYPTDSQIAAIPLGSTTDPFQIASPYTQGSGLDLRDNPNALYQRMGGTAASKLSTAYKFLICPYNTISGTLALSANTPLTVTLDNRSLPASAGPANDPSTTLTTWVAGTVTMPRRS